MMKREKFLELLTRKLSGEISDEDSELLDKVIEGNEEYRLLSIELGRYFNGKENLGSSAGKLGRTWETITAAKNEGLDGRFDYSAPKQNSFFTTALFKIAAMLVLVIGAGLLGYHLLERSPEGDLDKIAASDQKVFKILDDGTKIWLNKRTTISYNKDFGKHRREITLEGEAYFDVAKNRKTPLFIHAGNIDIEVKGTAFNVNAYKENPDIQVALVRGLIQVSDRLDDKNSVQLHPNEKLIFSKLTRGDQHGFRVLPLTPNLLLTDTKWTVDTLVFHKEKLKDLALRMEKKYGLKIEIQGEHLREKRFSGTFTDETIQQALRALKLSYPLTYTIGDKLVVIKDWR
ncbi:DUF4974 domain-containing protein [Pedobacter polaris]|uniref:DUF4974 domain-containing protein n=1 Tax=Pedobacter polaris TaxID=2571273 RepID=A0A4U1CGX7_9SPHI|nr:FecR domain-containing protein [Pedobacter polaris]TKC06545.1 DUF4974 domain-containing protein [Pedobacter polaris]